MYFICKEEELVGKEIAFTHIAEFAEAITLVTKDKGVMVIQQQNYEDEDSRTHIFPKMRAYYYIMNNSWIVKALMEDGVITSEEFEEYKRQKELERQKEHEKWLSEEEKREREVYERLKAKFETR